MMRDAILNFAKQFEYQPRIENAENFVPAKKFIVCGMGGSHLAADILKSLEPDLEISIHKDYGLPAIAKERLQESLIIASSYSGNTEEVIDAFEKALKNKFPLLIIATGGKLIELAQKHQVPYIKMPDTGIQPRSALGFGFLAMAKAMGQDELIRQARALSQIVRPQNFEQSGKALAERIKNFVPVIYSSTRNASVAYNWKIKLNETGKIPAFYNILPELNHNEMTGFDRKETTKALSEKFYFIILTDLDDHPQIKKRMVVLQKLYQDRDFLVETIDLLGKTRLERIFSSLLVADWTAFYTAQTYGLEPEQVPMVEEFKRLIS